MKFINRFLGDFFEIAPTKQKVVAIGGGIGTAQLLRGLKNYSNLDLTAIISMADDGGSAGRVRRAFDIQPPGDLITCLEHFLLTNQWSKTCYCIALKATDMATIPR